MSVLHGEKWSVKHSSDASGGRSRQAWDEGGLKHKVKVPPRGHSPREARGHRGLPSSQLWAFLHQKAGGWF